jgi:hypothetical protein
MSGAELPKYFSLLSAEEQSQYETLRCKLGSRGCRNNRDRRDAAFEENLSWIKDFCERGAGRDSIRSMVCGICWFPAALAVNIRNLRILTGKCKSSINGSLQRVGFQAVAPNDKTLDFLIQKMPELQRDSPSAREWSVRFCKPLTYSGMRPPVESPIFLPNDFPTTDSSNCDGVYPTPSFLNDNFDWP